MKIAIVGGGITGLTAAYFLSRQNHEITIFEKEEFLGGLAACFKNPAWSWPLEHYFHHYFTSDKEIIELARQLKINEGFHFKKPKTSIFVNGKVFRFDNPQSIFAFPHLNLVDKFRTGIVSFLLKASPFYKPLEKISAFTFIKRAMGKNTFQQIWEPLLAGKFGSLAQTIPASWFWTRIKKRGFSLGYFDGGTELLIQKLAENIKNNNAKILLNKTVNKITKKDLFFELLVNNEIHPEKFDNVVACLPPNQLGTTVPQLSLEEKNALKNLKSLGSVCLTLELKQQFLNDGTYWLNINDKKFPFVAVVEHTNFIDPSHYNNHHLLYVGGYYPANHPFFKMNKKQIYQKFVPFLKKINPCFNFELCLPCKGTLNFELFSDQYAQPVIPFNYSKNVPSLQTTVPGLFWGSLHHVYPQDRGVNYAILLGKKVANEIENS